MAAMKTLALDLADQALGEFLSQHPEADIAGLSGRWERGIELYQAGAVGPADELGIRLVRCADKRKPQIGDSSSYYVTLSPASCECGDWTWRSGRGDGFVACKHVAAVVLAAYVEEAESESLISSLF